MARTKQDGTGVEEGGEPKDGSGGRLGEEVGRVVGSQASPACVRAKYSTKSASHSVVPSASRLLSCRRALLGRVNQNQCCQVVCWVCWVGPVTTSKRARDGPADQPGRRG